MKPPQPLQLRTQDIPNVSGPVLIALNTFLRVVGRSYSNQLTISENLLSQFKTVRLKFTGTAADNQTISYTLPQVTGLAVYNAIDTATGRGRTIGTVTAEFVDPGAGEIQVSALAGLTVDSTYDITFLMLAESV